MAPKLQEKYINLISEQLKSLARIKNDGELMSMFSKDNFLLSLNFKLFSQITHFLLQSINLELACTLPWPVVRQKDQDVFIKELMLAVDKIKQLYSWAEIPLYQKSHFTAPSSGSDKVLEFLLGLTTTAALVVTGADGTSTLSDLEKEIDKMKVTTNSFQRKTEQFRVQTKSAAEKNHERPKKLLELRQELVREGFVQTEDEATLQELMKVKEKTDATLLQQVLELQKNNSQSHHES